MTCFSSVAAVTGLVFSRRAILDPLKVRPGRGRSIGYGSNRRRASVQTAMTDKPPEDHPQPTASAGFQGCMDRGWALFKEGDFAEALKQFTDAMDSCSDQTQVLSAVAGKLRALTDMGCVSDVKKQLSDLGGTQLDAPVPVRDLTRTALVLEMPDTALRLLDDLCGTGHDASETRVLYFRAHAALGDLASARQALDQALALDPRNGAALKERGRLNWAQGREVEALADCEAALAVDAGDADLYWAHGHLLKNCGRHDEAAVAYERFRAALSSAEVGT